MGYSVVGEFITQAETGKHISEALQQLRSWNLMWNPQFFVTDYLEAELLDRPLLVYKYTYVTFTVSKCGSGGQSQTWSQ